MTRQDIKDIKDIKDTKDIDQNLGERQRTIREIYQQNWHLKV